jgi:hypothetical protein
MRGEGSSEGRAAAMEEGVPEEYAIEDGTEKKD